MLYAVKGVVLPGSAVRRIQFELARLEDSHQRRRRRPIYVFGIEVDIVGDSLEE